MYSPIIKNNHSRSPVHCILWQGRDFFSCYLTYTSSPVYYMRLPFWMSYHHKCSNFLIPLQQFMDSHCMTEMVVCTPRNKVNAAHCLRVDMDMKLLQAAGILDLLCQVGLFQYGFSPFAFSVIAHCVILYSFTSLFDGRCYKTTHFEENSFKIQLAIYLLAVNMNCTCYMFNQKQLSLTQSLIDVEIRLR